SYAEQLAHLTHVLTSPDESAASELPVDAYSREQILLFAEENLEKHRELLQMEVGFLSRAFETLPELLEDYVADTTQPPYNTTTADAERFLSWLEENETLTPEQQDHVRCERARLGVKTIGRQRRREHLRFQELSSVSGELSRDLGGKSSLMVHLNPLRVWARF